MCAARVPPTSYDDRPELEGLLEESPSAEGRPVEEKTVEYVFTGKLLLFPVAILFFLFSAGFIAAYGPHYFLHGIIQRRATLYLRVAGGVLTLFSTILLLLYVRFIVTKITFSFTPTLLTVKKFGFLKSSAVTFDLYSTSFFYFRTHMNEDDAWLQLVIKENNVFFTIASWKGKGNQRLRFFQLFYTLQDELERFQTQDGHILTETRRAREAPEIVGREEVTLVSPFASRLRAFTVERQGASKMCIEDLPVRSLDSFWHHFEMEKEKSL